MIIVSVDKLECVWDDGKVSWKDVFWISFSLTKGMVWVTRVGWLEFVWWLELDMIRGGLLWSIFDEKEFVCWEFSELYMEIETKNTKIWFQKYYYKFVSRSWYVNLLTSDTGGSLHFFWWDTQLLLSPNARPHFLQRNGRSPKLFQQYVLTSLLINSCIINFVISVAIYL